jgi:serine/threonine-protein kinase
MSTVPVTVAPATASVEVDGAPAAVKEGHLNITGALGSVHHVRVTAGGQRTETDVVVAQTGAVPSRIAIDGLSSGPTTSSPPTPPAARRTATTP